MGALLALKNDPRFDRPSLDDLADIARALEADLGASWQNPLAEEWFYLSSRLSIARHPLFWSAKNRARVASYLLGHHLFPDGIDSTVVPIESQQAALHVCPNSGIYYVRNGASFLMVVSIEKCFRKAEEMSVSLERPAKSWLEDQLGYTVSRKLLGNDTVHLKNEASAQKRMLKMAHEFADAINKMEVRRKALLEEVGIDPAIR